MYDALQYPKKQGVEL